MEVILHVYTTTFTKYIFKKKISATIYNFEEVCELGQIILQHSTDPVVSTSAACKRPKFRHASHPNMHMGCTACHLDEGQLTHADLNEPQLRVCVCVFTRAISFPENIKAP